MGTLLVVFLAAMTIFAAYTRDPFVFTLVYLVAGAYLFGNYWNSRIMKGVHFKRTFMDHAFPGDTVSIRLELENRSLLPAVWLHVREMIAWDMATSKNLQQVLSM